MHSLRRPLESWAGTGFFARSNCVRWIANAARPHGFYAQQLRAFVKKNQILPQLFADFQRHEHQMALQYLQKMMGQPHFSPAIFDQLCHQTDTPEYLLYLMENQQISLQEGLTLYQFLMVHTQFSGLSDEIDEDVVSIRPFKLQPLVANGELTAWGVRYLQSLQDNLYQRARLNISFDEMKDFILNAPAIEQYMMEISFTHAKNNRHVTDQVIDSFMDIIIKSVPLFRGIDPTTFIYPPVSFMNFIFSKMNDHPADARPILGSIADVTRMHRDNEHPISLFNANIKSNMQFVHDRRIGPVPGNIHDWAHLFWMNLFNHAEREFILDNILPMLQRMLTSDKMSGRPGLAAQLTLIIKQLSDFDLAHRESYRFPKERLRDYLMIVIDAHLLSAEAAWQTSADDKDFIIAEMHQFLLQELKKENNKEAIAFAIKPFSRYLQIHQERKDEMGPIRYTLRMIKFGDYPSRDHDTRSTVRNKQ